MPLSMHWEQFYIKGGKLQAVGYYLQTLNLVERNYDIYNQELLAVVRALAH